MWISELSFRKVWTSRLHALLLPRTIRFAYHNVEQACRENDSWILSSLHVGGIPQCKTDKSCVELWFCSAFFDFFI